MASNNLPDLILFILEIFFGTLHTTMCYFIIKMRVRKNKLYCASFYSFYLCIAVMDFIYVLNNEFCSKIARLKSAEDFYKALTWPAALLYFLSAYSANGEIIGHAIIAINRYYALKKAQISEHQWSKQTTRILCILIFLIPLILCLYRIPFEVRYRFPENDGFPSIVYIDPVFSNVIGEYWHLYSLLFSSLIATVIALLNYRKIRKQTHVKSASMNQEIKLFLHSLIMFACFFARFAYQIALLIAGYTKNDFIAQTAQFVIANVASFYAFIGSFFLIIISKQVRMDYLQFYCFTKYSPSTLYPTWTSSSNSN